MKNFKSLRNQLWENSNRSSGFAGNSRPKGAADSAKHLAERARILGPAASIVDIYESRIASKLIEGKQLQEGVFDADILKAIFVIGGSGSGKSFISQSMFAGRNLKTVNPDEPFERFAKQQKLDLGDPEVMQSDYVQNILRPKAKSLTKKRYEHYIENRLGLIIDGTGRDARKIMDQKKALEKIGYDTYMVFVDVSLEQALRNNASRGRAVPEDIVREAHDSVRKNLPLFKAAFGRGFVTVENDRMVSPEVFTKVIKVKLIKIASKIMSKAIKNPVGRQWVDVMSGAAKQLVKIKTAATNRKEKDPAQRFRLSVVTESKEAKPPAIQLAEAQSISIESAATNLYRGVVSGDSIKLSMSKLMENLNHYRINCTIAEQYENQLQDGVVSHYREMGVDCKVARTNGGGFVIQRDKVHVFVECVGNSIFEVTPLTENAESVRGSYIDISYALKNLQGVSYPKYPSYATQGKSENHMKESNLTETISVKDVMKMLEKHLHIDVSELSNIKITDQHDNSKEMRVTFTHYGKKAGVKFPIKNGKIVGQPILGRRAAELVESFNMHAAKTMENMVGKQNYSKVVMLLRNLANDTLIDDEFKDFKFSTAVSKVRPPDKGYSTGLIRISNGHKNPRDKSNRIDIEVEMQLISGNPEFRVVTMGLDSKIVASDWQRDPSKAFKSFERQLPKNKGTAYMVESIKAQPPSGDMKKLLDEFGMMTTYRSYRRGTFKTFADKGEFAAIVLKIEYFDGKTHDDITSVSLETVGKTTASSSLYRKLLKFNKVGETATHRWQTTHRPLVDSPRAPEPKKGTAFREYIVLALANEHLLESSGSPNPKVVSEGFDDFAQAFSNFFGKLPKYLPSPRKDADPWYDEMDEKNANDPKGELLDFMKSNDLMADYQKKKQRYMNDAEAMALVLVFPHRKRGGKFTLRANPYIKIFRYTDRDVATYYRQKAKGIKPVNIGRVNMAQIKYVSARKSIVGDISQSSTSTYVVLGLDGVRSSGKHASKLPDWIKDQS